MAKKNDNKKLVIAADGKELKKPCNKTHLSTFLWILLIGTLAGLFILTIVAFFFSWLVK